MPDWRAVVRARLNGVSIHPATALDLTEELAQHLEDRYRQLRAEGLSDEEAAARSRAEIDGDDLLTNLAEALGRD
jgi:hypothetical protein